MVCAMDWAHGGETYTPSDPIFFYDVWIARSLTGDIFFDVDPTLGSWQNATNLFPFDPVSRTRMRAGLPFQVFACWNGAIAFGAAPLFNHEVGFRWPRKEECFQGEAQLWCKDLWLAGHGKIAVVPSVNLEYTDKRGRQTKVQKGYVSDFVQGTRPPPEDDGQGRDDERGVSLEERIEWKGPPDMVKCMPTFGDQTWRKWNETAVDGVDDV
ncbi:cryptococcal mannosyltransferase 1-domain-containing protein [Cercophora newfieldiana]|uniref:Cryptococcal mannosyltransferase 1-domain-containing protein n=1 Tax=Cercophora newfieldiana TaxID=92897 RepID=A0AA40CMW3_9PEZI|nr:cryptococcal mannosyltransferase 1-domain-containing protein [Cercophora newfieldiana]